MEQEKTIEQLALENDELKKQLLDFNERIKFFGDSLNDAKERNVKLAFSVRLFAETHLTRDEKISIAQEFDRANSAEQVERIYNKYKEQIAPNGVEVEHDFMWSPGFIRDLEKYYFTYKGFNPFEAISESIKTIRSQFRIEDEIRLADNPENIKRLKEAWQVNRENSLAAVDEILDITNEILKK